MAARGARLNPSRSVQDDGSRSPDGSRIRVKRIEMGLGSVTAFSVDRAVALAASNRQKIHPKPSEGVFHR